ncbi:hypothetical protein SCHPADRAFT_12521 [Schizopora paradoxa]|uniref:Uncharacterized protein n=1 Tax=Schizopora paradoxa TaxID=27342 RepID=A0A0H2S9N3_9AGAM|nr:hypothetical protein SCHPADRAFT_12521 [Schizopora paradoxa]
MNLPSGLSSISSTPTTGGGVPISLAVQTPSSPLGVATASSSVVTPLPRISVPYIAARDAQTSLTSTCSPTEVVLQITTAVVIQDFALYYDSPIQSFRPSYKAFADGSLIAPPYLEEVHEANWILLLVGALLMLFIRNSIVSADYIRRNRVKYQGLFYTLLISQLLGVLTFTTEAWVFLASHVNCKANFVVQGLSTELSAVLLLSGILGVKAYRCLGNSKIVLIMIAIPQIVSSTLVIIDTFRTKTVRMLSACSATSTFVFTPAATVIRFGISLFICSCFIYALLKASRLPGAQGRISLALSEQAPSERPASVSTASSAESEEIQVIPAGPRPRGWWDYVPEPQQPPDDASSLRTEDEPGLIARLFRLPWRKRQSRSWEILNEKTASPLQRIPAPTQQSTKRSTVRFSESIAEVQEGNIRATSPAPSAVKSLRHLMLRMKTFRKALRNELASTAITALSNVIATTLSLVGAFTCLPTSPSFLIGAHWAILSLLVIYSFGRVIERHEREALMQNPSSWDPLYKVEQATGESGDIPRALSTASVASNPGRRRSSEEDIVRQRERAATQSRPMFNVAQDGSNPRADNPFEDFEYNGTVLPPEDEQLRQDSAALNGQFHSPRIVVTKVPHNDVPTSPSIQHTSFRISSGNVTTFRDSSQSAAIVSPGSRKSDSSKYSFFHYDKS